MIIAPYVHIERADTVWTEVQIRLWQATRRCLDRQQLHVPVVAVAALGWRQLDRATWPGTLQVLMSSLIHELRPAEVELAASRVDDGVRPAERLSSLITVVHHLGQHWPVIMWQQARSVRRPWPPRGGIRMRDRLARALRPRRTHASARRHIGAWPT